MRAAANTDDGKREDQRRWDAKRRRLYAGFADACYKGTVDAAMSRFRPPGMPVPPQIIKAERRASRLFRELSLTSASHQMQMAAWKLLETAVTAAQSAREACTDEDQRGQPST